MVPALAQTMANSASEARKVIEAGEYVRPRRGEVLLTEVTKLGPCQVRSKTDRPCPHQAVTEIWGIPFCESCAREQEAYFAIGELTVQPQAIAFDPELSRRIEIGRAHV